MNAESNISKLLAEWLELTKAEGSAIQAAAWPRVSEVQARKAALQKSFTQARDQWNRENPGLPLAECTAHPFRTEVGRLLSLEERNKNWLDAQLNRAREQQDAFDQSHRNLHKVKRSYIRKQPLDAWQCYS
jgi:hypothetical protein